MLASKTVGLAPNLHPEFPILDAGEKLGGARKDMGEGGSTHRPSSVNQLAALWPMPPFRTLALSGERSVHDCLIGLALYTSLGKYPPKIDFADLRAHQWPALWRQVVLLVRDRWERGDLNVDRLTSDHDAMLSALVSPRSQKLALYAGGPSTTRQVNRALPLHRSARSIIQFHQAIGWPADTVPDNVSFGATHVTFKSGRAGWVAVEFQKGGKATLLDPANVHPDEESASATVVALAQAELERRAAAKPLTPRKRTQRPQARRPVLGGSPIRIGPENPRRSEASGTDIFTDILKMRGVEFGNWVSQSERRDIVDLSFDAYFDLCRLMRLPAAGASFYGRLGIAYGSRGKGASSKAVAHFEPSRMIVHLTKTGGAGSLAHEMGHAFDAVLGGDRYLSESHYETPVGKLMRELFVHIHATDCEFLRNAYHLDGRGKRYWSLHREMFARLFECWVFDTLASQGHRNDFLVYGVAGTNNGVSGTNTDWGVGINPYPAGRERSDLIRRIEAIVQTGVAQIRAQNSSTLG